MKKVTVMGMEFDSDNVPDFGSIRMVNRDTKNRFEYWLYAADAEKLNLITNAATGSKAVCMDTDDIYLRHDDKWCKK